MTYFRRTLVASLALIAAFASFQACGSDSPAQVIPPVDTTKVVPPVVGRVDVTGPSRLTVGRLDTVRATPRTAAGVAVTGRTVAFTSSSSSIVSVGATDGVARAVAPGTATITAVVDGISGTVTITASDASITSLTITPPTGPVLIGAGTQLVAVARDSANATVVIRSILWTSSNPNVATVSPTGVVTGVSAGSVTISAAVVGATAQIAATVVPVPVAKVVVAPYDSILHLRFPKTVVATALDSAGNVIPRAFTYTSSNVDVATLDPFGLVTATGQGTVTITVSIGSKTDSARFFVPSDSGFYVATTGGTVGDQAYLAIDSPNATSATVLNSTIPADGVARFNFLTSNGTYRARTADASPLLPSVALLLGSTPASVPVTLGPPSTVVSVPMKPYVATITAPATVAAGSTVTVSWTFDESTQPFNFFPDRAPNGALYYFTASGGTDLTGTPVAATVVRSTAGISTFTATFTAPSTAGTLYYQVEGDGAVAQLLYPIVLRGQALRTIVVQ
jgi:uncharacterized protein YjdB